MTKPTLFDKMRLNREKAFRVEYKRKVLKDYPITNIPWDQHPHNPWSLSRIQWRGRI